MTPATAGGGAPRRPLLLLYTNYFPYHRGEEYLEAELPYLVERFERIVVVPVMYEDGMSRTRQLLPRVSAVAVNMPSSVTARALHTVANAHAAFRSGLMAGAARPWQPRRFLFDLYFTTRALEYWKRSRRAVLDAVGDHDDVVVYSYWLFVTALEAVLLRRELGPRVDLVVSRAHRYDILKEANALGFLPQRRLLAEGLDRVYPVSDSGRASLLDDVGDLAGKVTVRRLGVAPPSAIGPRSNRPLLEVVSCSSLKPVKRVPLIVESLAALHARGIPFRWTHFGGNGPEFAHLARNAERVLPPGSFRLAGHLPNADVLAHYAARPVTLFLNVSSSEGVPVSIMEAMAHGIPALATAAGDTDRLVSHGHDGWVLPVSVGASGVADALESIWASTPDQYARYVNEAHQTWMSGWSTESIYREFAAELSVLTES